MISIIVIIAVISSITYFIFKIDIKERMHQKKGKISVKIILKSF